MSELPDDEKTPVEIAKAAGRAKRIVEVKRGAEWVRMGMMELVVGDRFRMFEADGKVCEDEEGTEPKEWIVCSLPEDLPEIPGRHKVLCEPAPMIPPFPAVYGTVTFRCENCQKTHTAEFQNRPRLPEGWANHTLRYNLHSSPARVLCPECVPCDVNGPQGEPCKYIKGHPGNHRFELEWGTPLVGKDEVR